MKNNNQDPQSYAVQALKDRRKAFGMDVIYFAKELGIPFLDLESIERGEKSLDFSLAVKMAKKLHLPWNNLVKGYSSEEISPGNPDWFEDVPWPIVE